MRSVKAEEQPVVGRRVAARGRRRGWWLLALALAALLVLPLADRLLVGVVERRMSGRLACLGGLTGARAVHIHGFPFLTQAASGHFRAVTVKADGIRGAGRLTDVAVTFRDLRLPPLSGLSGRPSPDSVTVGSIVIAATIRLVSADPVSADPVSAGPVSADPVVADPVVAGSVVGLAEALPRAGAGGPGLPGDPRVGGLPFPVHLDAVRPVPGGARLTLSVPGAAVSAAIGRLGSDCAAVAPSLAAPSRGS
jgi:hypothetical protein